MMKVERIDFVTFFVKDLDKATKFFSELFETQFIEPYPTAVDTQETLDCLGINLAAPLTADGPSARFLERRGEGVTTVVISVADIEEAVTHMEAHGIRLVGREFRPNGQKTATYHPKDLCGVFIELMEE